MSDCTADLGHPCSSDNGRPCSDCRAWADHYRRAWNAATPAERDPVRYRREMLDAGRARLLRSEER